MENREEFEKWCLDNDLDFNNINNLEKFNHRMIILEDIPYMIYGSHLRAGYYICKCPTCNTEYKCRYCYDYDKKEYEHNVKYCPECGQKIISLKKDL